MGVWTYTILLITAALSFVGCRTHRPATWAIQNPYEQVNWDQHGRYKSSLHTHTRASDGDLFPHEVIDGYQALGYDVLAITDHNLASYPWAGLSGLYGKGYEDRDPETVGMLDIPGNEFSRHHHMASYWTLHPGNSNEVQSLESIHELDGQAILCHPGRYKNPVEWYVDLFERYDHLVGMEIYNQGDRYPGDRAKWDAVLSAIMPDRPVWGFSNDDMHRREQLGRNWNILLLPELTETSLRRGLNQGLFFFVYAPKGHAGAVPPVIESLMVDARNGIIQARVSGHDRLEWISEGKVVHDGEQLNLNKVPGIGGYVRLTVYGARDETVVGTQPFGIRPTEN